MRNFTNLYSIIYSFVQILLFFSTPSLVYSNSLEESLHYILSDKEQMNYEDKHLQEILQGQYSDKYLVFKLYKAFIDWDSSKKSKSDINKAVAALKNFGDEYSDQGTKYCFADIEHNPDDIQSGFLCLIALKRLLDDMRAEFDPYYDLGSRFPLWLVLKYPEILEYDYGRFPIEVAAANKFSNTEEFQELSTVLHRITDGNWATTSYYPWRGTIHRDVFATYQIAARAVDFSPGYVLEHSNAKEHNLLPARAWSSQGLWENLLHQKLLEVYSAATLKLEEYYLNNYGFDKYAESASKILSYVINHYVFDQQITHSTAFKIIYKANGNFEKLRLFCANAEMGQKDWDELFGRAILEGFEINALKWLLDSGSDIKSKSFDESPLMKATNKPNVLKFLLAEGADIESTTSFGKTPIFYAIQFGDFESVEILINAGADINKPLYSLEKVKEDTMIEQVVDFTPLVYAMRYADKHVIDYLKSKGATLGEAPIERVLLWLEGQGRRVSQ